MAACSSFSYPSRVTSIGVPDGYSIVAIARSSSTAGKNENFNMPLNIMPIVSTNIPAAKESAEKGFVTAFKSTGL